MYYNIFLQADASTSIRVIFICHILACLCQLLMFTYSCDCIIRESGSIATAAYKGPWLVLPMSTSGRMMRKDLTLIILRSHIPCCLTGKGFFVVSLETYTSVSNTVRLETYIYRYTYGRNVQALNIKTRLNFLNTSHMLHFLWKISWN